MESEAQRETPLGFMRYFQNCRDHNPDEPKWQIGLIAAEQWFAYHQNQHAFDQGDYLSALIRVLLPYRFAGSGFSALWMAIVQHLARLSVLQQLPGWQAIFEPAHQGVGTIPASLQAQQVIAYWRDQAEQNKISEAIREEFVRRVIPGIAASTYEWIEFVKALDRWFARVLPNSHFFETVIATYQQHHQA